MPFLQVCILYILVYLLLYNGMYFSAPIDNGNATIYSLNSTSFLLNETMIYDNQTQDIFAESEFMYDYRETLPDMIMSRTNEAEFSKVPELSREPLDGKFVSKEESHSFLNRGKRASRRNNFRAARRKLPDTGPLQFRECRTQFYRNFRFQFPRRETWWPKYQGHSVRRDCLSTTRTSYCTFSEVYAYYAKGWDTIYRSQEPWTYEQATAVWRYSMCDRGDARLGDLYNCPSPCAERENGPNPCNGPHTTKCIEQGSGLTKSYRCNCDPGWNWNPSRKRCEDVKMCATHASKCVASNTRRCVDGVGTAHSCECKPQYMGDSCTEDYDACIDFNNPCGNRGICIAHRRQQTWTCDCDEGWGDDPAQRGRDCNKKNDPCGNLICRNGGECQHSANGNMAYCLCPEPYHGNVCEIRSPQWNEWMPWNDCDVTCGTGGKQRRTRTCDHLGAAFCGGGQDNEAMPCSGPLCLVDGEWGAWAIITPCSHNCDGGKYLRARNCEYDNNDPDTYGEACQGELLSYEDCNVMTCPSQVRRKTMVDIESLARSILAETGIAEGDWGAWNSWTSCTDSCGQGFHQRGRMCLNSLGTCEGDSEEFEDCYETDCDSENEFLPWSGWSTWSMCGPMTPQCTRTRHCPYGENDPISDQACPGESVDEAPCRYNTCTGEAPASLVDVANVMGGDVAMHMQMGNLQAAGLHPNSYLNAAAPGFAAPAPMAMMAPMAMAPMVPAGYPAAPNMNGYGAPPPVKQPEYEKEAKSAVGAFGGFVFIGIMICCGCFLKRKFGNKDGNSSASGYQTKDRLL